MWFLKAFSITGFSFISFFASHSCVLLGNIWSLIREGGYNAFILQPKFYLQSYSLEIGFWSVYNAAAMILIDLPRYARYPLYTLLLSSKQQSLEVSRAKIWILLWPFLKLITSEYLATVQGKLIFLIVTNSSIIICGYLFYICFVFGGGLCCSGLIPRPFTLLSKYSTTELSSIAQCTILKTIDTITL